MNKTDSIATIATKPQFTVTRIIKGFEFGHGQISGLATNNEVLELVDNVIYDNPDILVPIDKDHDGHVLDDDGCGDGRAVLTVFSLDHTYKRSLNRSKVFGGSATMTTACLVGLGDAGKHTLNQVFERAIKTLDEKGMDFGAHTDEHMHGNNCGCGAIDKAPQILFASLKYEIPIRGVITMLSNYVSGLNDVYASYRTYVKQLASQPEYSGMDVMNQIINSSHIVKQLGGDHHECRIVLNTVRGFTVNQKLVRDATQNEAQIFAVDVWRMEDIAHKLFPNEPERQHQAFISELIYTVATAAVLTKGDLPVDVISQKA
jgi:hypothetical protein